jgi:hypothetical protein
VSAPPDHNILWSTAKIAIFGSVPLYIVVRGINLLLVDITQPQYIVVGDVDKTFFDYIIIATTKRLVTAFCVSSRLKISFFFLFLTFTFTFLQGGAV